MKIAYCSDLHIEFGDIELENRDGADVLIIAGDTMVIENMRHDLYYRHRVHRFMSEVSYRFNRIIMVLGNHEHYFGDFATDHKTFKKIFGHLKNVVLLENSHVKIEDITFVGGTLWTNMNGNDPMTKLAVGSGMNDFTYIKNSRSKEKFFTVDHAARRFDRTVKRINKVISDSPGDRYVVVTHHAPSKMSVSDEFKHAGLINGGYASNLDSFILNHQQIEVWFHGHIHSPSDYKIGSTRVLSNPRGYSGRDPLALDFELQHVEI